MAFVKLDCGILNSTLWVERESRDIFITALLMAQPFEVKEPMEQLEVSEIRPTGFVVPPGWYGFVEAAGPGIVRRALADMKDGMEALRKLGEPDSESRSSDFDGRRLVRVNGGYIVLNYMKYRDKDSTSAVRSARYRERKKMAELSRESVAVTRDSSRGVTIAEAEAEAETPPQPPKGESVPAGFAEFWALYPKKVGKDAALSAWKRKVKGDHGVVIDSIKTQKAQEAWTKEGGRFVPNPATWLNQGRWKDEVGQGGECSAAADWTRGAV